MRPVEDLLKSCEERKKKQRKPATELSSQRLECLTSVASRELADIVTAAGLTHGAVCKHFASNEDPFTEALELAFVNSVAEMDHGRNSGSLESIVASYLSKNHRDYSEATCPLPSLGGELRFANEQTKAIATRGAERLVEIIAKRLPDLPAKEAKIQARGILATLVVGMLLSRLTDSDLMPGRFLKDAKAFALAQ